MEFMVLVLQLDDVYREPILGFATQKVLGEARIALVSPIICMMRGQADRKGQNDA